ncbi:aromatic ring-hydroxylating dioxygenase subunit alpha [Bacillus salipaludis]|uniref:Aromatic ring-hydroxylating dioxygenase subunit alpha n=1 Tax=Bacillus salipaludis TaxID=2547811 RepID=A0A4R5VLM0_9BACI|nr:aromatic ring-hydroxylating dioxygenase subunit alpha [Bacillus salipaludis]MDQ6599063.1 aromatic ring-hydroxylating dioxygenase subunit alpha [Bacillus salipaludis]TDK58719.1 aromatic ring-hydroxylating dioxygenase subunit alpha [Bacillus salipaludis]
MNNKEVRVSENLSEAHTLPSWLYTKPEVLEVEKREIFCKTWQYVGHISQVTKPGDYFTTEVADRPIIVSCGQDGEIHAFYNVCTHRAAKLAEGEGNKQVFTCPYHAWTFRTDGSLLRAPNMGGCEHFDYQDFCLKTIQLEIIQSFIFVNLDPDAPSMVSQFPDLFKHVEKYDLSKLKKIRVKETICKSNWKIGIDNYLECDHCSIVHKTLVSKLDMKLYEMEMLEYYSYQGTPLKGKNSDFGLGQGGRYYWLYPNTWFSFDPGPANLSIHQSIPIDHKTTKYVYTTFFMTDEITEEEEELMAMDQLVRKEDLDICEVVQKGIETGAYTQGRFSLTENLVHQFHLLLQRDLETVLPLQTADPSKTF